MNRMRGGVFIVGLLVLGAAAARADVTLLLEEPYGRFGGMTPTGHAAIFLSRVCAASPLSLRRCHADELGVVISRYHRIGRYDWIAIPVIPYLYAVERVEQVPREVGENEVESLRDGYRRQYLRDVAPDASDGGMPVGDWTQLVGAAYDRTIYAFGIQTTEVKDEEFIQTFNSRANQNKFHLLFRNCADFTRLAINFYFPKTVRRSFSSDFGIMTPKQTAKCLVRYSKGHPGLASWSFIIDQVPGTVPRSRPVRGVVESLLKSKRYILPMAPLAMLHPYLGGTLILAWVQEGHFNPQRMVETGGSAGEPEFVARELESHRAVSFVETPTDSTPPLP